MNLRTLLAIVRKEFRQIRRDPTSLGMLLVLPSALIVLVGYALNFDVRHIPLVIYDQDRSEQSREFLRVFRQTEYFDYLGSVETYDAVEQMLNTGEADAAVVVPVDFSRDLAIGLDVRVQVLVDGSDANSAGQAVSYASRMMSNYSMRIVTEAMLRAGREPVLPVDFQPRVWYNPDLTSSKYLLPGLIGFILVLTAVVSTSMTVVREKERGTMEQILVSPVRPLELILGKTIPYLLVSIVAATMILVLGYLLFDIIIHGSILLLYLAIFILVVGALAQGLLISTVTDSQQVAFMVSVFSSLLPSFLLSGFVFPVSNMPTFLQVISNIAVAKFFLAICRGIILKGTGLEALWEQFLYMTIFALVLLGISVRRMGVGGRL
jgi:ABC-2 type transport system permease protein